MEEQVELEGLEEVKDSMLEDRILLMLWERVFLVSLERIILSLAVFLTHPLSALARWREGTMLTQRESVRCSTSVLEEGRAA
jgi:hypothetical protein